MMRIFARVDLDAAAVVQGELGVALRSAGDHRGRGEPVHFGDGAVELDHALEFRLAEEALAR